MRGIPETRQSLLVRIQDPHDRGSWDEFMAIYRPAVYRIARRRGIQDADAQDLCQRVFISVAKSIHQWNHDRKKARFRTWLYTITRNAVIDHFRAQAPDVPIGGTSVLKLIQQQSDETQQLIEFQQEVRRSLFRHAATRVQHEFADSTWQAFWLTAVNGQPAKKVAQVLNISRGAIYIARSRVMKRLRHEIQLLETNDTNLVPGEHDVFHPESHPT